MAPLRALLIDLDGVLRVWDPADFSRAEEAGGLPPGCLRRAAFAPDLLHPAITGRLSDEAWREQVRRRLQAEFPSADAARAVAVWSGPAGAVREPVLALTRACRHVAKVVLVTNATSRLPSDLARLRIAGDFDAIINSSAVGWAKPDPAIYRAALRAAGVEGPSALLVDDVPENVDAAVGLGMAGHPYRDVARLREALLGAGLLG